MKKVTMLVVALLIVSGGCNEGNMTTWVTGESDAAGIRVGYMPDDNLEVGGLAVWHPNDDTPQYFGVYSDYHFDNIVEIPNPIPIEGLPETFKATPFVGGQVTVNARKYIGEGSGPERRSMAGPEAGFLINKSVIVKWAYQAYSDGLATQLSDAHIFSFGLFYRF